jgi:hypothetical protein
MSIDSLDAEDKQKIWESLHTRCANRSSEDRWSEKHFHEFLPELRLIVGEYLERYSPSSKL